MRNNLKEIIIDKEIEEMVKKGKAKYFNWGQKTKEIVYVGESVYWKHTANHYLYLGERILTTKELVRRGF